MLSTAWKDDFYLCNSTCGACATSSLRGSSIEAARASATPPIGRALIADAEGLLAQALEHNLLQWSRAKAGAVSFGMGPLATSLLMDRYDKPLPSWPGLSRGGRRAES
jgi:hypothetical protein